MSGPSKAVITAYQAANLMYTAEVAADRGQVKRMFYCLFKGWWLGRLALYYRWRGL